MNDTIKELPIGFFDSGVGGISVLQEAISILPFENYIYYGDSANVPYGNKSECDIKSLTLASGEYLFHLGVKAIVMACNTATSIAVQIMREKYKIPVISIEPAVKPAITESSEGYVLVMATPATLQQKRYNALLARIGNTQKIINIPCSHLAQMIENTDLSDPAIREYIQNKFLPLKGRTVSGIVIGCTHYSFISSQIYDIAKTVFAGNCTIFDGKIGTAKQLKRVLEENNLINPSKNQSTIDFYTSGSPSDITLFKKFLTY